MYSALFMPRLYKNCHLKSEWEDLNLRPLTPKASALPSAPHSVMKREEQNVKDY